MNKLDITTPYELPSDIADADLALLGARHELAGAQSRVGPALVQVLKLERQRRVLEALESGQLFVPRTRQEEDLFYASFGYYPHG